MSGRFVALPLVILASSAFAFSLLSPLEKATAAPAPIPKPPSVEVVFCLDTTGSMTGLIDAAKSRIWSICNQILNGRPMPELKVGLVAFRDKGDETSPGFMTSATISTRSMPTC